MGHPNQPAYINFHKMAKAHSEGDFKSVVDKSWLLFHAEIGRLNPEFKKTKKMDFFTFAKIARGCTQEDFIKFATGEMEIPPVKLKPDELKSLRGAMELFSQLIPLMDGQFGCDWFFKQAQAAPATPPVKAAA